MVMSIKPKPKPEADPPKDRGGQLQAGTGIQLESVSRMFCSKCGQKINTSIVKALSEGRCPACGEKIIVEGKVGPYRILKLIGQGGMGAVYEGFDDGLGRKVAIKVTLVDVTHDRVMLETFQREAQVVAKLNHPNVVQVYAFGEEKGHPYLVMELLPAGSLLDRINGEDPVDVVFLMGVALEVLDGLSAAQEAGLLHGDIKPENILFDDKMHAKLVDFGLAAMNASTTVGEVWGTPFYIAPEKVTDRKANLKCDIYSLGASLYHALAKRPPFDGTDGTSVIKAAIEGTAEPLSSIRPDLPSDVEAIIARMMEKDVVRRYPNYKSIIADIKRYLATVPREQTHKISRVVNHGGGQKTGGTKKIMVIGSMPSPAAVTSRYSVTPAAAKPAKPSRKGLMVAALLVAGVGILGGAGYGVMMHGAKSEQERLFAKGQKVEAQYSKVFTFIQDSYSKAEKLAGEAQQVVAALEAQSDKLAKGGAALAGKVSDIRSLGQQINEVLKEAEAFRSQAEKNKPAPLTMESVDVTQLAKLQQEVSARLEDGKAVKVRLGEADRLLAGMKSQWAALETEAEKIAANAQRPPGERKDVPRTNPGQTQRPSGDKNELAKGVGKDAASVDLAQQKGLREFKLNDGESLVLAVWQSNATEEGGGVLKKVQLARKGGEKAEFKGEPVDTALGTYSLKAVAPADQFPAIARTMDALSGPKSGNYVVPSAKGIQFNATNDPGVSLSSSGQPLADTKEGWAPALVFTAKQNGFYSLSGTLVLQAQKPQTTLSWMAWVLRPPAK